MANLDNTLALENLSPAGKPPKMRLSDPHEAHTIVSTLIEASRERVRLATMVEGMFNGNAPYSPSKLRTASQTWRSNFSTLEGKAHRSAALAPYYDLFASVPWLANVECEYGSAVEQPMFSRIESEEMDYTLRAWPSFEPVMGSMLSDFVGQGKGFLMWQNKYDLRFRYVKQTRVLVPDASSVDPDEAYLIVVRQNQPVHKLWETVRNQASAKAMGWNVEAVLDAIRNATPDDSNDAMDYERVQQKLRDHDMLEAARSTVVKVAHLFVREFGGKWSHMMIDERDKDQKGRNRTQFDFMFKRKDEYDYLNQFICPFFFEVLEGTWNGVTGLGKDIYAIMQQKDRVRCSQVDALMMRMGITMKALTQQALQKIGLVQLGPFNVVPPDFEVLQSTIYGDIEGSIAVNKDLDGMVQANTGIYRPRIETGPGNPETATEVQLKFAQSTVLSSSAVNRFYTQLDRLYAEVYRRLTMTGLSDELGSGVKMAREFQERCKKRGVPEGALRKTKYVRAYRNIGNGSVSQRQQSLIGLMAIAPRFPETGFQNYLNDIIATAAGESKVDRYNPKDPEARTPKDQVWQATVENDSLSHGSPAVLTPTQNDIVHAQTHLGAAAAALQSVQEGADPYAVLKFVDNVGPHIMAHIQRMSGDPTRKDAVVLLMDQWKTLASTADDLRSMLEQQRQQQQQQQEQAQAMSEDAQIKAAATAGKLQLQKQKQDATLEMKREAHNQSLALKREQAGQGEALADATTAADMIRKNAQHQQSMKQAEQAAKKPEKKDTK